MSNASISTNNLTIGYDQKVVQRDLSFSLFQGEMVCMLGPNGCGKSTLLRTLAGLQPAIGGTFEIQNTKSNIQNSTALVLTERLSLENTTIHDVVAMGRYPYTSFLGGLSAEDEQVVSQALANVGLEGTEDSFFNAHSDGEKQRALIAKAIAQDGTVRRCRRCVRCGIEISASVHIAKTAPGARCVPRAISMKPQICSATRQLAARRHR